MDLEEIECEPVDWITMAQDGVQLRVLTSTVMNLRAQ
jgi:hypothetical protein